MDCIAVAQDQKDCGSVVDDVVADVAQAAGVAARRCALALPVELVGPAAHVGAPLGRVATGALLLLLRVRFHVH